MNKIYHFFDPSTKIYSHSDYLTDDNIDPNNPDSFLIPGNATDVPIPEFIERKNRIFNKYNKTWDYIDIPELEENAMFSIEYDKVSNKYIYVERKYTLEEYKALFIEKLRRDRNSAEQYGFEYNGDIYDSDPETVTRILCAQRIPEIAQMTTTFVQNWNLKNGGVKALNYVDFCNLIVSLGVHSGTMHEMFRIFSEKLLAAKSMSEVDAIYASIKWR